MSITTAFTVLVTLALIALAVGSLVTALVHAGRRDSRGFRPPPSSRPFDGGPGQLPNLPYSQVGI